MTSLLSKSLNLPPLVNGDRLTRLEFERRYDAMPKVKKPHGSLITWLGVYQVATPQVQMGIEPTVRLDIDNEPQPDGVLFIKRESGGNCRLSEDGYIEGAPELVIEVAASSVAIDLGDKKRAYRRNGVQEYLVWQVFEQKIDWFSLQDGDYISLVPDEGGIIHSQVFPGLWLDGEAMLKGNMQQVLNVLQLGINSTEHQAFVQK
ncbi:MAG: hypothetical protein RLZZ148_3090 [Cyanobacteriota bacterium]